MDDSATVAASSDKPWLFRQGNTQYRARKQRIAERVAALATEYVATSAVSKQLLEIAAVHLDTAARTHSSALRGRATRLAVKVLDRLERKPQETLNAFDEYLAKKRQEAAK
jgi:hypothetical protein